MIFLLQMYFTTTSAVPELELQMSIQYTHVEAGIFYKKRRRPELEVKILTVATYIEEEYEQITVGDLIGKKQEYLHDTEYQAFSMWTGYGTLIGQLWQLIVKPLHFFPIHLCDNESLDKCYCDKDYK